MSEVESVNRVPAPVPVPHAHSDTGDDDRRELRACVQPHLLSRLAPGMQPGSSARRSGLRAGGRGVAGFVAPTYLVATPDPVAHMSRPRCRPHRRPGRTADTMSILRLRKPERAAIFISMPKVKPKGKGQRWTRATPTGKFSDVIYYRVEKKQIVAETAHAQNRKPRNLNAEM